MNWGSFSAFISMGGYGLYVWGSYLVTVALLCGEVVFLMARYRAAKRNASSPDTQYRA